MRERQGVQALVWRERRAASEARRDREMLAWIARFRFVTGEAMAQRFGVTVQRANARLRRYEQAGLVRCDRRYVGQARAVFVTPRGCAALGLPARRTPRPDVQRSHELAIVWLVVQLELEAADAPAIYVERELRERERARAARYSVEVTEPGRRPQRHWPDVVVEREGRRLALELEFSDKGSARLRRILGAYAATATYDEVRYLVRSPALAARITRLHAEQAPPAAVARLFAAPRRPRLVVDAWPQLDDDARAAIRAAAMHAG